MTIDEICRRLENTEAALVRLVAREQACPHMPEVAIFRESFTPKSPCNIRSESCICAARARLLIDAEGR